MALDFPAELGKCQVPELILQPLVENAIKHGMSQPAKVYRIRLGARRDGDRLQLEVANTGRLVTTAAPSERAAAPASITSANACNSFTRVAAV